MTCSVPNCNGKVEAHGWCKKHYKRWWRTGAIGDESIDHSKIRGEYNHQHKLTNADILRIRALWDKGLKNQREIAREYAVSSELICLIVNRKRWKHIKPLYPEGYIR